MQAWASAIAGSNASAAGRTNGVAGSVAIRLMRLGREPEMLNLLVGLVIYGPMLLVCAVFVMDGTAYDRASQRR